MDMESKQFFLRVKETCPEIIQPSWKPEETSKPAKPLNIATKFGGSSPWVSDKGRLQYKGFRSFCFTWISLGRKSMNLLSWSYLIWSLSYPINIWQGATLWFCSSFILVLYKNIKHNIINGGYWFKNYFLLSDHHFDI